MTKRGKLEIMRDILKIVQENKSIKPTPLLRKSNLSSSGYKEYYEEILSRQLVTESLDKNGAKIILITEKGIIFLQKYNVIIDFIDEFEL